jgi:hypothetical protein
MDFVPTLVRFASGVSFSNATVRLKRADNGNVLGGASVGVPPVINGKFQVDLATHGLYPTSIPSLQGVDLVVTVQLDYVGFANVEEPSMPFQFAVTPQDVEVQ